MALAAVVRQRQAVAAGGVAALQQLWRPPGCFDRSFVPSNGWAPRLAPQRAAARTACVARHTAASATALDRIGAVF